MRSSIPLTDSGQMIGIAVEHDASSSWFLVAIDERLKAIDRSAFPSAAATHQAALRAMRIAVPRRPC